MDIFISIISIPLMVPVWFAVSLMLGDMLSDRDQWMGD